MYTKFGGQAPIEAEKTVTEIFWERKKNGQIQELISNMWLILCYTVQLVIPNVCTKFQNPKSSSFREIFDRKKLTNTHAHTQTEKAKTIYPLYTSYAGGIIIMFNGLFK